MSQQHSIQLKRQKVSLRVPATTANLGPAYDTLGMALSIFMHVTVEVADSFSFVVTGEGAQYVEMNEQNMIVSTCKAAFADAHVTMPPLKFTVHNDIPYGCGCGSSSASAVAGYVAGLALLGNTPPTQCKEQLLSVIAKLEGHPDNAAPAIYGGIQLSYYDEHTNQVKTHRVHTPPNLFVVLFTPCKLMKASTHVTRQLVPQQTTLKNAIHNISRTAMLMLALTTNNLNILSDCGDVLHEQQRSNSLYPHYTSCAKRAREVGACYVFLSGAGPTVCAFVPERCSEPLIQQPTQQLATRVANAMVQAARSVGVDGRAIITQPSDLGVHMDGVTIINDTLSYVNV